MKTEYLLQWIQSDLANKKKRAIEKLTNMCLYDESLLENFFEELKKIVNEDVGEVRAAAYKAMRKLALKYERITEEIMKIYVTKFRGEELTSRAIILSSIRKITEKYPHLYNDQVRNLFQEAIDSDDVNLKSIAIKSLSNLISLDTDFVLSNIDKALAAIKSNNTNLIVSALDALKEIVTHISDEKMSEIQRIAEEALSNSSYLVRAHTLILLNVLLRKRKIVMDKKLITLIKKRLRDESILVKIEALKLAFVATENNPNVMDEFLGIIVNEYLIRERNKNLKLITLSYLNENINKIPKEILHRHNLPKVLDIIDKNTVRKNKKLSQIKKLARDILEKKLGVDYERRRAL